MHLQTMVDLCVAEYDCVVAQHMIDSAREKFPFDQAFQYVLDTKQAELDEKLGFIHRSQRFVRSSN
jgi:hypothetical protein